MEQTECFEMSAYKIQTPGNHPEENIQHTEHGESLKSIMLRVTLLQKHVNILLNISLTNTFIFTFNIQTLAIRNLGPG
jgi:hypothetical protein